MNDKYKRISRIENFLNMLMAKSGCSDHYFTDRLTQEVYKDWDDMVYYEVNSMSDLGAIAYGSASIYLYAKPSGAYGRKNVKALDAMEEKLDAAINAVNDEHYVIRENWRDSGYDTDVEFFYNVVNISVYVK